MESLHRPIWEITFNKDRLQFKNFSAEIEEDPLQILHELKALQKDCEEIRIDCLETLSGNKSDPDEQINQAAVYLKQLQSLIKFYQDLIDRQDL